MMLRRLLIVLVLMSSYCKAAGSVEGSSLIDDHFKEGTHYIKLEQPLPQGGAPVIEFMYFGCRVCFQLAPALAEWSYKSGIEVALIPAHSENAMVNEARMFHVFEQMNILSKMYEDGYVIVQTDLSELQGADRINSFLEKKGIETADFWVAWQSVEVAQKLQESARLTKQVKISKTPTFVVHGIYKIDVESLTSVEELFELLNYLVGKKPETAPLLLQKSA